MLYIELVKAPLNRLELVRSKVCIYLSISLRLITVDLSLVLHSLLRRIGQKSSGLIQSEDSELYRLSIKIVLSRFHRSGPTFYLTHLLH
jgi:hypothetical protein